jgi:hypothetical protein
MTPAEREKLLAREAETILGTLAFKEACEVFVFRVNQAWLKGDFQNVAERESAFARVQAFNQIVGEFKAMLEGWKVSPSNPKNQLR